MIRKPLHPASYRPPLNLGGHNFGAIRGNVVAPGQLVPEVQTLAWRCQLCGHIDTKERVSAERLNAAAWAPCLAAVTALPRGDA
jgi:hypothetical protein